MGTQRDQLKQELSKLSHKEVVDRAINYAIELDREYKMRLAEKQIYTVVQKNSLKVSERNKKLENDIAVFCSLFVELLKLIHASTTKLEACIAAYNELKIQLQHSQEVNVGLNNKIYAPSTERLDNLVPSTHEKIEEEAHKNVCEDNEDDTISEQNHNKNETVDVFTSKTCDSNPEKDNIKILPQNAAKSRVSVLTI